MPPFSWPNLPECRPVCTSNPRGEARTVGDHYTQLLYSHDPRRQRTEPSGSPDQPPRHPFQTPQKGPPRGAGTVSDRGVGTTGRHTSANGLTSILISRPPKLAQHSSTPTPAGTVQARLIRPHQVATKGRTRRHSGRPVERSSEAASPSRLGSRLLYPAPLLPQSSVVVKNRTSINSDFRRMMEFTRNAAGVERLRLDLHPTAVT